MDEQQRALDAEAMRAEELRKEEEQKREDEEKADREAKEEADQAAQDRKDDYDRAQDDRAYYAAQDAAAGVSDDMGDVDDTGAERRPAMSKEGALANQQAWDKTTRQAKDNEAKDDAGNTRFQEKHQADDRFQDIQGNAISMKQMEDITRSRQEMHASLKEQREAAAPAGHVQAEKERSQAAKEQIEEEQTGFQKAVAIDVQANEALSPEEEPLTGKGAAMRARFAEQASVMDDGQTSSSQNQRDRFAEQATAEQNRERERNRNQSQGR